MEGDRVEANQYVDLVAFYSLEAKVLDLTNKVDATQDTLWGIANQSYLILIASNKNLKTLISRLKGKGMEKLMIITYDRDRLIIYYLYIL